MALEALSILDLDTSQPFLNVVHAKQFDSVRKIEAHLFFSGVKWYVPAQNIYALVSYKKSSRISGMYDYTEEGSAAIVVDGDDRSIIYINLDKSLLTSPGEIRVEVIFFDTFTEGRLSGFSFNILVEATALNEVDLKSNPYFNILAKQIRAVLNIEGTGQLGPLQDYIDLDTSLSTTSTNAVQNKVIAEKFSSIHDEWTSQLTELSRNVLPYETVYSDETSVPSDGGSSSDSPIMSLPDSDTEVGNRTVGFLQSVSEFNLSEDSPDHINVNLKATISKPFDGSTPIRYKGKSTNEACLFFTLTGASIDTIEASGSNDISLFDFDMDTGLLALEVRALVENFQIIAKQNNVTVCIWNVTSDLTISTYLADDDAIGG